MMEVRQQIKGRYMLLKKVNHFKKNDILDSENGAIEGVWCPKRKKVITFTDSKWFKRYKRPRITQRVPRITQPFQA